MKRWLRSEGRVRRGPIEFEWYESVHEVGRVATLQIGRYPAFGPNPWLRFRVVNEPSKWTRPHRTKLHLEFGRNRFWVVEFRAHDNQYREVALPKPPSLEYIADVMRQRLAYVRRAR